MLTELFFFGLGLYVGQEYKSIPLIKPWVLHWVRKMGDHIERGEGNNSPRKKLK